MKCSRRLWRRQARRAALTRRLRPVSAAVSLGRERFDVMTDRGLYLATLRHEIEERTYIVRPAAIAESMLSCGVLR